MVDALAEANDIVRMDHPTSPVPEYVRGFHAGDIDLLEASRLMAERLQQVQTGVTSDGLLAVARATRDGTDALVVAKMEHERGARAEPQKDESGLNVYRIEVLDDLFLTSKTKVFKIALFDSRCADFDRFRGRLTDSQAGGRHLADYFLFEFLGCQRARRAEVLTLEFFKAAGAATKLLKPQERAQVHVALVTELKSSAGEVRVRDFTRLHVPVDMRDDFMAAVEKAGVPTTFTKDLSLIEPDLNSIQISFENGSVLYSLPDQIGNTVVLGDDTTTVNSRPATVTPARKRLMERFPEFPSPTSQGG